MKNHNVLAIVASALVTITGTMLLAQTTKPAQPKDYDNEQDYEKAYVDSYKNKGRINAVPISVDAPEIDPTLLYEYDLPLDVKIEFTVDEKGKVRKPVVKSDTDFAIADAVVDSISEWRFRPAIHDGKAVSERMLLTMEFIDNDEIPAPGATTKPAGKKASTVKLTSLPPATIISGTSAKPAKQ